MSAVVDTRTQRLGADEFLAWEEQQERRNEFIVGEVHSVTDQSIPHKRLVLNLALLLDAALDPDRSVVFNETVKFRFDGDLFYPDVLVTSEEYQPGREWVESPEFLAEVLSPDTLRHDRDIKWPRYQRVPSLQTYLLVAQHRPWVQVFRRGEDGWTSSTYDSLDDVFTVTHPACRVSLKDIYRRVVLRIE